MNTEVEYNLPPSIQGDPPTRVVVDWSISFEAEGEGENASPIVKGTALAIRVEVGGEPFPEIRPASLCSRVMRDWIAAREKDLNPEVIGMTAAECLQECGEEEAERRYLDSQTGRPI